MSRQIFTLLALMLAISCGAQVITNTYWKFGTNGFSIFVSTVRGTTDGNIYMWQSSTDLSSTNWVNESSGIFYGSDRDLDFIYVIDGGNTNKCFRVVQVLRGDL